MNKKSVLIKLLSCVLTVLLVFQTTQIGVFGATSILRNTAFENDPIINNYTDSVFVYSGSHSFSIGRAGTFELNDYTLQPELRFDALSISSNVFPVSISFQHNSSKYRYLKDICAMENKLYGSGWLTNYTQFISELTYLDGAYLLRFDDTDATELFSQTVDISAEEALAYPNCEKWISAEALSDTVIWKAANQYTVVLSDTERQIYDSRGRLTQVENTAANTSFTIEYDSAANAPFEKITKITDGIGNEYRFTYTSGKLSKIKCYDTENNAIIAGDGTSAKPLEVNLSYTGDCLTGFAFPDEQAISFTYDNTGNLTSAANIDNSKLEISYSGGAITGLTEKAYDASEETYIIGETLAIAVPSANVRTFTDGYGHQEIKTFDEDGNILTIVDENGNYLYGAPEEDATPTDATPTDATPTDATPTDADPIFTCVCPCSDCSDPYCECDCTDEASCTCLSCKRSTYNEFDSYGNITAEKRFDGVKTLSELSAYTTNGARQASSTDSSGNTVYYTYDTAGFLDEISAGTVAGEMNYDAVGNLTSFSQDVTGLSNAAAMTNSYTFENDKIKTISHNGFTYEYNYDIWGNKTEVKIGSTVLSQTDYGTGQHRDRVSEVTYANGQSVSYTYDSDSNITAISYDGGQTDQYEYAYDNEGILTQITDNHAGWKTLYTETGTEVRSLSDNSLLFSSVTDETGATEKSVFGSAVAYTYNTAYNAATGVTTDTVVMAKEAQIGDDSEPVTALMENAIDSQKDWFGRTVAKQAESSMSAEGMNQSLTSEIEYSYADTATTATTRLASYSQTITGKDNTATTTEYFEYDALGNITGVYRYIDNVKTYYNRYYYDEASQIVREDNRAAGKTITYQYDKGGNLAQTAEYNYTEGSLAELTASQTDAYSYRNSGWKDVITGALGFTVTTDAMGNITDISNGDGKSGVSYEWTAGRQLAKTTREENGTYYLYYYDADGFLCRYEIYNSSDVYQGAMNYYWEDGKLIAAYLDEANEGSDDCNIRIIYDTDGEPFGFLISDTIPFYYGKNYLGDITAIYDFNGDPVIEYYYDAFGNMGATLPNPNDFGAALLAVFCSVLNPLAYRGYMHAPALGSNCYYLGSRFYSPDLHRFANADVYEDTKTGVGGTNMFAYCGNNPIAFTDPTGKSYTDGTGALKPSYEDYPEPAGISGVLVVLSFLKSIIAILATYAVDDLITKSPKTADQEIRKKIDKETNYNYWKATKKSDYVQIGKGVSEKKALQLLKKGNSIFARSKSLAKEIAKKAGDGKAPEFHYAHNDKIGYYDHYHPSGHPDYVHVWYLS